MPRRKESLTEGSLKNMDFLESEFKAVDENENGFLYRKEVYRMLIFQGVEMMSDEIKEHFKELRGPVDLKGFNRFMNKLPSRTRKLREIFALFNNDESSLEATKEGVLMGLEKLGVQHRDQIIKELVNTDNLVTYKDFVRLCFKAKDLFY